MSRLHFRLCLSATLLILGLSGCQIITQQPVLPPSNTLDPTQAVQLNQFSLQGKIGVKTPEQSGSAFYTWIQGGDQFSIQLNGILGMGKTIIEGQPGQVSLDSSKTGVITAASAEELLEQATGWVAPIAYLVDWVQARPATVHADTQKDENGRVIQLNEEGWLVNLSYADAATLPNKLILKQQRDDGQENRITLVIQNR